MTHRAVFPALPAILVALGLVPGRVLAHCDTMNGPVIKDAQVALESRDLSVVLKWVKADQEKEVRDVFQRTLAVRALAPGARELADRYFFETLVRIHREGEGAPYTGLKAGVEIEPAIAASDEALETGSVDVLVKLVAGDAERGIRTRFANTVEARKHIGESVERGRDYVAAYVEFTHYAERLHADAVAGISHQEHQAVDLTQPHQH